MTMVPERNLSGTKPHFQTGYVQSKYATGYCKNDNSFDHMNRIVGGGEEGEGYECNYYESSRERDQEGDNINSSRWLLGSDLAGNRDDMSDHQDDSRTNSDLNNGEEAGSSSKPDRDGPDPAWLQLGVGRGNIADSPTTTSTGRIELDLLPPGGGFLRPAPFFQVPAATPSRQVVSRADTTSFYFHPPGLGPAYGTSAGPFPHPQEISWAFRPFLATNSASSSSLMPVAMGMGSYFGRPFPLFHAAGPSSDVRVIAPPRRPHSGVWFMLQASPNQVKEPFLPQIPKSYLRIKDGRMTIRLLMKYLANKLRLGSESEIEIRCRGEELRPFLTLQHVRDNIWTASNSSGDFSSSPADHVMVLHYSRTP